MKGPYRAKTEYGTGIWHVERLWELTRDFPVQSVPLTSLPSLDEVRWFNRQGDEPKATCKAVAAHAKLIYEADLSYPVILSMRGDVMDGMHRIAKAWMLGLNEVKAVQFTSDPAPDRIMPFEKPVAPARWPFIKRLIAKRRTGEPDG